jgi:hypothetical protein
VGIRSGSGTDIIPDLPVIYNLVHLGEVSQHAVSGLDVTAEEEMRFAMQPLGGKLAYVLAHPPGRVVRPIEART